MKTKHILLSAFCLLLPIVLTAQFTDGVSITVNGQKAQRQGNSFSMLAACGPQQAGINVTAGQGATVKINGTTQSTATVNLPAYGNNIINVTVTPQSGSAQSYTLTVNKPVPFSQIVIMRWNNTLTVINNPANNGGYTFNSFKWFRNGVQFSTGQSISAGPNGELLNPADVYYVEVTAIGVAGVIRSCATTVTLQ
jgi:hypothetical protein